MGANNYAHGYTAGATTASATADYVIYYDGTSSANYPDYSNNIGWHDDNNTKSTIPELEVLQKKIAQLDALFFRKVVVKCEHCGQWGAAMSACKHCGAPIDLGKDIREEIDP